MLCCRETEQDLYNILGALYTAVLFVSLDTEPACCCSSPCSLPGLPADCTHTGRGASPGGKALCCFMCPLAPPVCASLLLSRPAKACPADLQLPTIDQRDAPLSACSWVS